MLTVVFFASGANVQGITFAGLSLLGVGEWINQPRADVPRKARRIGILFQVAGAAVTLNAICLWFWRS